MVDDAPIPLEAVPAIRAAVRDPLLLIAGPIDVAVLAARTANAWHMWHQSTRHRADLGRLLPRVITDARIAARAAEDTTAAPPARSWPMCTPWSSTRWSGPARSS